MTALIWTANLLGWPLIHIGIGSVFVRMQPDHFTHDNWLTAPREWEHEGRVYRDLLSIRSWKHLLPDGAPWIGADAKKKIYRRDSAHLAQFQLETRRAEVAHWCMLCCLPVFFLWNPPWACLVMTAYALAANLPCILAQRYNRLALNRVLQSRNREVVHL